MGSSMSTDETTHRAKRTVRTESVEEIRPNGDTALYTQAILSTESWECECGEGPFESEEEAKEHLGVVTNA